MDESNIIIRIEKDIKEQFMRLCRERDTTASQVIRRWIREAVEAEKGTRNGR